jgi:hypothetical protein
MAKVPAFAKRIATRRAISVQIFGCGLIPTQVCLDDQLVEQHHCAPKARPITGGGAPDRRLGPQVTVQGVDDRAFVAGLS